MVMWEHYNVIPDYNFPCYEIIDIIAPHLTLRNPVRTISDQDIHDPDLQQGIYRHQDGRTFCRERWRTVPLLSNSRIVTFRDNVSKRTRKGTLGYIKRSSYYGAATVITRNGVVEGVATKMLKSRDLNDLSDRNREWVVMNCLRGWE